jgi:hypothetical protein
VDPVIILDIRYIDIDGHDIDAMFVRVTITLDLEFVKA